MKEYDKRLHESFSEIPDFSVFKDSKNITDYLKKSIAQNKKILIYGDYDTDGIMSTSIVYLTLYKYGYKAGYYIPNREHDGYGLTIENIKRFKELGYDIIILVDNGISLNAEIDYLNSLGMECIILDHHSIMNELPKAKYIMHPDVDNYGEFNISAGVVSFYFSWVFLGEIDDYLLVLAGISTLSDIMPLVSYNRILVKETLRLLNQKRFNKIIDLIGMKNEYNEDDLQIAVIPKINAICRLINDNRRLNIVKYFVQHKPDEDASLLRWIESVNKKRKELVQNSKNIEIDDSLNVILVENVYGEGINGLIANSLLAKYNKPVFVISRENENKNLFKGSARAFDGFNVVEALNKEKDLLVAYGGHEGAGGFTIDEKHLEEFKNDLNNYSKVQRMKKKDFKFIEINKDELTLENYDIYRSFGPFGEKNERANFKVSKLSFEDFRISNNGEHLIMRTNDSASIVYFNFDKKVINLNSFDVIGKLSINEFRGNKTVQLIVSEIVE